MTRALPGWRQVLIVCTASLLAGCAFVPTRPPTLQPDTVRSAIESATLVPLEDLHPPLAASGLGSMRTSMSGSGPDGTITVLVFWSGANSAMPLGSAQTGARSVLRTWLSGGVLALRRLNVLVLYARRSTSPDLSARLSRALADIAPS